LHLGKHAASTEASTEKVVIIVFEKPTTKSTPESEATFLSLFWLSLFLSLTAKAPVEEIVVIKEVCEWVSATEERLEYVIGVSGRKP
jgi:hypothetical protein